ncbi:hypothetical protein Acr_01g0010440 [Actinidia rufa]|uniref:Reverse transcriptase domain-containing protein n=1 Tax=Actinidia rufa TaxID=165716 RepID=A0A7J0E4D0_9ERIC|nr:hypothetical protein Acr_01g0010440 [Actinidia rufa]
MENSSLCSGQIATGSLISSLCDSVPSETEKQEFGMDNQISQPSIDVEMHPKFSSDVIAGDNQLPSKPQFKTDKRALVNKREDQQVIEGHGNSIFCISEGICSICLCGGVEDGSLLRGNSTASDTLRINFEWKKETMYVDDSDGSDGKPFISDLPSHASSAVPLLLKMPIIPGRGYIWQCMILFFFCDSFPLLESLHIFLSFFCYWACMWRQCCYDIGLSDLRSSGTYFTWSNNTVWCKLDRAMVNSRWTQEGILAQANFDLPGKFSDHSPCIVTLLGENDRGPSPFKFFNMWAKHDNFLELVSSAWQMQMDGTAMYKLCKRLKALKGPLKILNRQQFSHISARTEEAEENLAQAQQQLHDNPGDSVLQATVLELRSKALKLAEAELSFCSQLAQAKYLKNSDKGTKFFHNLIKSNRAKNFIASITLEDGSRSTSNNQVSNASVQYYMGLLGTKEDCIKLDRDIVLKGNILEAEQASNLIKAVSEEEIKSALFSIGEDKAPGPDGYTSCFYKKAWNVIGKDFTNAVKEFFSSSQILKQINRSVLALIPKSKDADNVEDFRPIACCNVVYKVISKIIASRLAPALISIVNPAQAAFVQNRSMMDNIFMLQELLRNYGRKRISPRCILNVDLRKAFDSVDWEFVQDMLSALQFPPKFVAWIIACISSPTYSVSYNGSLHGGDPTSVSLLMENLNHFRDCSGLQISISKSCFHSVGIEIADMEEIQRITDKISGYISAWAGAKLSYASRTELVKSVLQGLECFWLSIIPIPAGVRSKIIQLCRNFLWSGNCNSNKKPLIAWNEVTMPKSEGGLGIRNKKAWNKALLSKTLWDIQAKKDSLWVQWVHQIYMSNSNFWDYKVKHADSPLLKQVIALRDEIIASEESVEGAIQRVNQWTTNGEFQSKEAYDYYRQKRAKLAWPKMVWHNSITPKHSFILWLGLKDRLLTKDKLQEFSDDRLCPLCRSEDETVDHLFFRYRVGGQIWAQIKAWLGITRAMQTIKASVKWLIKEARGTGLQAKIKKISLACTVYHLWEARNQRIVEGKIKSPEALIRGIQIQVRRCINSLSEAQ